MFIHQEYIMETIYLSQEGMDRLQAELKHMKAVERPAAAKAIAEARERVIFLRMLSMMQPRRHKDYWRPRWPS